MSKQDFQVLDDAGNVDPINAEIDSAVKEAMDDTFGTVGDLIPTNQDESAEAPSGESETPSQEAQSEESTEAQPRDDKGRFKAKQEAQSEETPSGEEESTEEGEAGETETDEVDLSQMPEIEYRADGKPFSIPGSAEDEAGGLYIPPESAPQVKQLLAAGQTHQGSFRQHMASAAQRVKEAEEKVSAVQASKSLLLKGLDELLALPEDQFLDQMESFRQKWPDMKRQSEIAERDELLKIERAKSRRQEATQKLAALRPRMEDKVEELILEYGQQAGLAVPTMKALFNRIIGRDQELARVFRSRDGRLTVDREYIRSEIAWLRDIGAGGKSEAEERNQRVTSKPKAKPKTPSPKGGKAVSTDTKKKVLSGITDAASADAFLSTGKYNELFE